ncbi:MAG: prenyltransferase/squalene oxidase repeat-containing protein [Planctomycetota bacterium]
MSQASGNERRAIRAPRGEERGRNRAALRATCALAALGALPGLEGPWARGADPAAEAAPARRDFREVLRETPLTRAVDRGVEYLARTQLPDGSWFSRNLGKNTGVSGLAALALLSAGHVPGRGPYGENVERCVRWIVSSRERGMLATRDTSHGPLYEHGIATLLIGEVLGMVAPDRPGLEAIHRVHAEAVDLLLRAQDVPKDRSADGGWRYLPWDTQSDISVTGWQVLALKSAQTAGAHVPRRAIDRALAYVKRCQLPSGGFGYMPGSVYEPNAARTGTGTLVLEVCGAFDSPEARRGGDWLLKNPLEWKAPFFYYAAYYAAQAAYQLGGRHWTSWRSSGERILLERQGADGSWPPPPGDTHEAQAGPAYTTALAVLALTVEYRYLPVYQR